MASKVLTIDGPAGSGKSTIAENIARKHGFLHLNSGLLYRSVGLFLTKETLEEEGVFDNDEELTSFASAMSFQFLLCSETGVTTFWVGKGDGDVEKMGAALQLEEVGEVASKIAVHPKLRETLNQVQRQVAEEFTGAAVVVEGRDAGTCVFPDAYRKFFITASLEERARRIAKRAKEVMAAEKASASSEGSQSRFEGFSSEGDLKSLARRDGRDSGRKNAPLEIAEGAIVLETDNMSVSQVLEKIEESIGALS